MNEFSQADELAPWQAPFRKSLHSSGWAQHHSKLQQNAGQGEIPVLVWCLGPFRLWFIPKQLWQWEPWLAVTTSIAWHHLNLFFFSFWSAPVSQGRAGSSDGPWAHCSPSALLSLAAGLQLHLEPWSYIKILKFSPNRICRWEQRWCCIARRFSLQTSSSPWGGNPITLYV